MGVSQVSELREPLLSSHNKNDDVEEPCRNDHLLHQEQEGHENYNHEQDVFNDEEVEEEELPVSPNVKIVLAYTFVVFVGRSIWNQNVLATLAFLLRDGDPKAVGFITGAMGLCQLIISIPTGVLADKYRRDTLLKVASAVGLASIGTTIFSTFQSSYVYLLAALCVWGCFWGIASTTVMAIFADSVHDGQRSHYFTSRSILINLGNVAGPIVALIMFKVMGDEWTIPECSSVLAAGQIICLPAIFLLCLLNDDYIVGRNEPQQEEGAAVVAEGDEEQQRRQQVSSESTSSSVATLTTPLFDTDEETDDSDTEVAAGSKSNKKNDEVEEDLLLANSLTNQENTLPSSPSSPSLSSSAVAAAAASSSKDESYDAHGLHKLFPFVPENRIIPIFVAIADVTAGIASGMSIRYFAIFIYDNLQISPVNAQILYILTPLLRVALLKLVQYLGTVYGRCRIAVTFKWIAVILMFVMVVSYLQKFPLWVTCTVMIVRAATMNSTGALTRSVLMDNVPKSERAKWSALESLNMFSWSGSAVLGGFLVGYRGIIFNFCITATFQFIATFPTLLLSFYAVKN